MLPLVYSGPVIAKNKSVSAGCELLRSLSLATMAAKLLAVKKTVHTRYRLNVKNVSIYLYYTLRQMQ